MKQIQPNHFRVLAFAPTSKGVGFAVLEGQQKLVDWGVKSVQREKKNDQSVTKVKELINQYKPGVLVLQDMKGSSRSARVKALNLKISAMTRAFKVEVKMFTHEQMRQTYFPEDAGTKQEIAEIIAQRFPEQLASHLPPKRKAWMSEQYQMGIFDAVALAFALRLKP